MDASKLRDIILNARQPYVLTGLKLPWNCFQQTFEDWCQTFDTTHQELIPFEGSTVKSGKSPQWERQRTEVQMKMSDICKSSLTENERWNTFSYRNIDELPEICRRGVNFECFGFPEVRRDITFWIGSAHAHTPCHYDTYGCNIVVQVYGRKSWILLPPEAKLTPMRVPFEESSVYCKENFYCPASYGQFIDIENEVYHTVLEAGMALIVPPKWWHFVENLEPSLSFNTWLRLERDVDSLVSECITKIIVQDFCSGLPENIQKHILNPNEDSIASKITINESHGILSYLLNQKRNNKLQCSDMKTYPFGYLTPEALSQLIYEYETIAQAVPHLPACDFFHVMQGNSSRYDLTIDRRCDTTLTDSETKRMERIRKLINTCCSPAVVELIVKALLEEKDV